MITSATAMPVLLIGVFLGTGTQAVAQTFTFERSFPATASTILDVTTERGKITVRAGTTAEVVVVGRVSRRVAWNSPRNAVALARSTAAQPPIEFTGDTVRLQKPNDGRTQRPVTIAYDVQVPAGTRVVTHSQSGETRVETGSGAVSIDRAGPLSVTTSSSGIEMKRIRGTLYVRTQSGQVWVSGNPRRPWKVTTGSSAITAEFSANAAFFIDATSGSGAVESQNLVIRGESDKRRVEGSLAGGGPIVQLRSRSGSITPRSAPSTSGNSARART